MEVTCKPTSQYEKYVKPKYASDPEFRAKRVATCLQYQSKLKERDTEAYKSKVNEFSKNYYNSNEAYREKKKAQARERYYRLKALSTSEN